MSKDYPGIDYSPRGSTVNRNPETGIRYGIIHANELSEYFWDDVEDTYHPHCPYCEASLPDAFDAYESDCPECQKTIDDGEQFGEQPDERTIDTKGIKGFVDSSCDVWVVESPFYTRGTFCSPCAPGAVSIGIPCDDGPLAYCFPADWYPEGKAPHPIYRVSDCRACDGSGIWTDVYPEPGEQPGYTQDCDDCQGSGKGNDER